MASSKATSLPAWRSATSRTSAGWAGVADAAERRRPESNRRWEFCRLLPYHLATAPYDRESSPIIPHLSIVPQFRRTGRVGVSLFRRGELLTGIDELIQRCPVLPLIQVPVPAAQIKQLPVRTAFHDLAFFDHENLIGAGDGR